MVDLLKQLGVGLDTVCQPNQKPFVEGGLNSLWTYLSVLDGQVGRYRGEMEEENRLVEKCKAGRADPREHFPSLAQAITALDGALAMRNSDTVNSIYGRWVPEVRFKDHAVARPWNALPEAMAFLFAPYVREWTVAKATVGGKLPLLEDFDVPFYFSSEELWRWNGRKVRLYFDPAAEQCTATIVSLEDYHGFRKGEVICRAELVGDLPHFARASFGWSEEKAAGYSQIMRLARAACRREVRALSEGGQVKASASEARDGQGNVTRIETQTTDHGPRTTEITKFQSPRPKAPGLGLRVPTAEQWQKRRTQLAEQAEAAAALTPNPIGGADDRDNG